MPTSPLQHRHSFAADTVTGIEPVYGWSLLSFEEEDSDGFWRDNYVARQGAREVLVDVSCFQFKPTQERFAWLVRNGFPRRPTPFGGWSDAEIDARIAAEREAMAA
ncbi:hypothetical protein HNO88_002990 [Novosphingobium chloroacetimidivorans]|uniref:Uncharacterized protein n=1 Tax=Novosphingobium chloroacetimidivorans TaxID=1428314 RepID=A0A7W7KBC9_9SPHN|nr:hypothetical protein [Novosphingobium chloroacetimidivorans]MBB4859661.1 hypothetical protein [Novosphingobium chloroacetimidivorans]